MRAIVNVIQAHSDAWPFAAPVNPLEVTDYYDVVKDPVDMELIQERVSAGNYYVSLEMFCADFRLMFNNCRIYNSRDTRISKRPIVSRRSSNPKSPPE